MKTLLDKLAEWWLVRRGKLFTLKPRPMRIEVPGALTEEEAQKLRDEWAARR